MKKFLTSMSLMGALFGVQPVWAQPYPAYRPVAATQQAPAAVVASRPTTMTAMGGAAAVGSVPMGYAPGSVAAAPPVAVPPVAGPAAAVPAMAARPMLINSSSEPSVATSAPTLAPAAPNWPTPSTLGSSRMGAYSQVSSQTVNQAPPPPTPDAGFQSAQAASNEAVTNEQIAAGTMMYGGGYGGYGTYGMGALGYGQGCLGSGPVFGPWGPGGLFNKGNLTGAGYPAGSVVGQPTDPTGMAPAPVPTCGDGCCTPCTPVWFGSAGGMIMNISGVNSRPLAYQSCYCEQLLNARDPLQNQWQGGYQLSIGRTLGCNCAVEGVFWWINPYNQTVSTVGNANNINTGLDFTTGRVVQMNNTEAANNYFQGSASQSFQRFVNIYNLELNFLHQPLINPCARCGIMGLAGVRWLHIGDGFNYTAVAGAAANVGTVGNSATYAVSTTNNLVGFQIGARCHYYCKPTVRLFAIPKVGIYGNAIGYTSSLTADGGAIGLNYNGSSFYTHPTGGSFATVGQIDAGGSWQLTPRFSLFALYRVMGVTGLALSTAQIPQYMADLNERQKINYNNDMIIHGALIGGQYAY